MSASIRMDEQLLERLKQYARSTDRSASSVVREALTLYLDGHSGGNAYELGADLFGRYSSKAEGTSSRSEARRQIVRQRIHERR